MVRFAITLRIETRLIYMNILFHLLRSKNLNESATISAEDHLK